MFGKLLILLVLGVIAFGVVAHASSGAGPERSYVVKPADTLWAIAAGSYSGDTRAGVWRIEQRNHLHSELLRPGQKLVLP